MQLSSTFAAIEAEDVSARLFAVMREDPVQIYEGLG
jgi:hypothetical protein